MKKLFALVLAMAMFLTACSSSTGPVKAPPEKNDEQADPAKYQVTEPITIEFWHAVEEQYRPVLEKLVDEFEKANPNITVNCLYQGAYSDINEKFLAANTAGGEEMPSLLVINGPAMTAYAQNGILEPLDDYVTNSKFPIDDFAKGMVEAYQRDDQQFGLPFLNSAYVWFYNKTLAEAEGIEMPKKWEDIDAFMQKAAKPTLGADGIPERYAAAFGAWDAFYFESLLWGNGCTLIKDDNNTGINDAKATEMSEQFQKWCDADLAKWCYGKGASSDMRQAFMDGKILAVMHTSSLYKTYTNGCDFEVGVLFPPVGEKGPYSEIGGCSLGIPSSISQEKKNAAWALMQYLTTPESNMAMVEATGYLPTRPSTIASDVGKAYLKENPNLTDLFDHLDSIYPQVSNAALDDIMTKWETHLAKAINEKGNMKEELSAAAEEINEILADQ